jgi:hypothetical protein
VKRTKNGISHECNTDSDPTRLTRARQTSLCYHQPCE